ncbi:prepilin-type N-terminal cleavage/methylation domain-containing protein [Deinococcus sp. HMF7620]|uniref:Prepilin-type N-terminal cleavage/methylation domain-containing protein n=1 Tax=Deinococcus arboris TaxID=2682977 RepID=A0A7C9HT26_9DEIO|nr:prepilin-type N-terminal cleavage/methylation domain-containing protein [Deinococcus arboris]
MRSNQSTQAGFTIIELLIALAILGIAMTTVMSALLANTSLNTKMERQANAVRISEQTLEAYRQRTDYAALQKNDLSDTVTMNGQSYTVVTDFCPNDLTTATKTALPCNNTSVYIRVEVKYGTTILHRAETYFTQFGNES